MSVMVERWRRDVDALALWLVLGLTLLAALDPALRHLKYLPLVAMPVLFVLSARRELQNVAALYPYLLLVVFTALLGFSAHKAGWRDALFILAYCLPFLLFRPVRLPMVWVNSAVFAVYLLATLISGQYRLNFSWVKSATFAESAMSFVAGLFLLYWLTQKKDRSFWLMLVLNSVFLLLSMKRAALLGLMVAALVLAMPALYRRYLLHPALMVALNLALIAAFVQLGTGALDGWAREKGVVLRCLPEEAQCFDATNGRLALIQDIAEEMHDTPQAFILRGKGPGANYQMMKSVESQGGNLHNDMMRIAYEFGWLLFAGFIYLMYRCREPLALAFAAYLNVVFYFDNVLIYTGVMVFVGLLLGQASLGQVSVRPHEVSR